MEQAVCVCRGALWVTPSLRSLLEGVMGGLGPRVRVGRDEVETDRVLLGVMVGMVGPTGHESNKVGGRGSSL